MAGSPGVNYIHRWRRVFSAGQGRAAGQLTYENSRLLLLSNRRPIRMVCRTITARSGVTTSAIIAARCREKFLSI